MWPRETPHRIRAGLGRNPARICAGGRCPTLVEWPAITSAGAVMVHQVTGLQGVRERHPRQIPKREHEPEPVGGDVHPGQAHKGVGRRIVPTSPPLVLCLAHAYP